MKNININFKNESKWIDDHTVCHQNILPGSHIVTVLWDQWLNREQSDSDVIYCLENLTWLLPISENLLQQQAMLCVSNNDAFSLEIEASSYILGKVSKDISAVTDDCGTVKDALIDLDETEVTTVDSIAIYEHFRIIGVDYGKQFKVLVSEKCRDDAGEFRVAIPAESTIPYLTILVDAIFQTCIYLQTKNKSNTTVVPHRVDRISISHTNDNVTKIITRQRETGNLYDVIALNEYGDVVVKVEGVKLATYAGTQTNEIAVYGNITLDPILPFVDHFNKVSGLDHDVELKPYNQYIGHLLDKKSSFYSDHAFNIVVIALQEWLGARTLRSKYSSHEIMSQLEGFSTYTLPSGDTIAHNKAYETKYLYDEIFQQETYAKHGIVYRKNACVIDIGANIGMYALYVNSVCTHPNVLSFEPSPPSYEIIHKNTALYTENTRVFNVGIGDRDSVSKFTHYKNSTVFSSFEANEAADRKTIASIVNSELLKDNPDIRETDIREVTDKFLENRLEREVYEIEIKTLSTIIQENNIEFIDVLKIDAEKYEIKILDGIQDEDWKKIGQIIIEFHNHSQDTIDSVKNLLVSKNYELKEEEETALKDSGLMNIYAIHRSYDTSNDEKILRFEGNKKHLFNALDNMSDTIRHCLLYFSAESHSLTEQYSQLIDNSIRELQQKYEQSPNIHIAVDRHQKPEAVKGNNASLEAHIPYRDFYYYQIALNAFRALTAYYRHPKKVIVVDCDYTLWRGVCTERTLDELVISTQHQYFHQYLKQKQKEGFLLCVASRNKQASVENVFNNHKDIMLSLDDFVIKKINWDKKSDNIRELASELSLGLDSVVFIDDSPYECAEVSEQLPSVTTLQFPRNENEIETFVNQIWYTDKLSITQEDKNRTRDYVNINKRETFKKQVKTLKAYIEELDVQVACEDPSDNDFNRLSQITTRTNQFNVNPMVYSLDDLKPDINQAKKYIKKITVSDKLGDYGIVGMCVYTVDGSTLQVESLMLSCRVLNIDVEYRLIEFIAKEAKQNNCQSVSIQYTPSGRNDPALDFLDILVKKLQNSERTTSAFVFPTKGLLNVHYDPDINTTTEGQQRQTKADVTETFTRDIQTSQLIEIAKDISGYYKHTFKQASKVTLEAKTPSEVIIYLFAELLAIDSKKITPNSTYESLNIESLDIVKLMTVLEKKFGALPKTLLFEYLTVDELTRYFENNHSETLAKLLTVKNSELDVEQVEQLKEETNNEQTISESRDAIAVIGINGLYPRSSDVLTFWEHLKNGDCMITDIPQERWKNYISQDASTLIYSNKGGFIDDVDKFDSLFFGISPAEAELLDPQQRLSLQCAWHAIEDAGYNVKSLSKKTGVFMGVMTDTYGLLGVELTNRGIPTFPDWDHYEVANRISYHFNFSGPSMAIDTACSSSLTSIHLASESLRRNECDYALAGGVHLILHPSRYVQYCQKNMLSNNGESRPFDETASGFIDGEGLGIVLLKRLNDAIEDKDNIIAIIKGSAVNATGKTNGFTVPSPLAQAEVINQAIGNSKIDPDAITYMEAHGTGTALGDPIEISGINKAFNKSQKRQTSCAVGSVKSNIGHLEAAAGIAGFTKVVLQLRNKTLVPSIGVKKLNQQLELDESNLHIQTHLEKWSIDQGNEQGTRIAGISSFGAGGSNAHIVVEEYNDERVQDESGTADVYVPLSAVKQSNLISYVNSFAEWLDNKHCFILNHPDAVNIAGVAATLQKGRVHHAFRVVIKCSSIEELTTALRAIATGATKNNPRIILDDAQPSTMSTTDQIVYQWVTQKIDNWPDKLASKGNKISLPGYSFSKVRLWLPTVESTALSTTKEKVNQSPIGYRNVSTLTTFRVQKDICEEAEFYQDHIVYRNAIVPAAYNIEMLSDVLTTALEQQGACTLYDIHFVNPLQVTEKKHVVVVALEKMDAETIRYTIRQESDNKEIVAGFAKLSPPDMLDNVETATIEIFKILPKLSMEDDWYSQFREYGLHYGQQHQRLNTLLVQDKQVFAQFINTKLFNTQAANNYEVPDHLQSQQSFILDAGLQTAVAYLIENKHLVSGLAIVPSFIGLYSQYDDVTDANFVHTVFHAGNTDTNKYLFTISLYDSKMTLVAKIEKIIFSALYDKQSNILNNLKIPVFVAAPENTSRSQLEQQKIFYVSNVDPETDRTLEKLARHNDIVYSDNIKNKQCRKEEERHALIQRWEKDDFPNVFVFNYYKIDNDEDSSAYATYVHPVIHFVRLLLKKTTLKNLHIMVVTNDHCDISNCYLQALSGFFKTVVKENPNILTKMISADSSVSLESILQQEFLFDRESVSVKYREESRYVQTLSQYQERPVVTKDVPANQVTIVTGGKGQIAREIAKNLVRTTHVVLLGRSQAPASLQAEITQWNNSNPNKIVYKIADVSVRTEVGAVFDEVRSMFGNITGVIHCAGVLNDRYVINKSLKEFDETARPKTKGTINLDLETKDDPLQYFVLFSSVSGYFGNIGQSDYAYANAFLDNYCEYRDELRQQGIRQGISISTNWPLWRSGGMHVDGTILEYLRTTMGMVPISNNLGIDILYYLIENAISRSVVGITADTNKAEHDSSDTAVRTGNVEDNIRQTVSRILKIDEHELDVTRNISQYGFNSISYTELATVLNTAYQAQLTPATFYEYATIHDLSEYVVAHGVIIDGETIDSKKRKNTDDTNNDNNSLIDQVDVPARQHAIPNASANTDNSYSLIGMEGIFPGAPDTNTFWHNSANGINSISEIPESRFDWRNYYGDPYGEKNKIITKHGGFIDDVDCFDEHFFGLSSKEAMYMDPQQRLLLQTAWKCIEDAGYTPGTLSKDKKVGVFIGATTFDYNDRLLSEQIEVDGLMATGLSDNMLANRISHYFDFEGPSEVINTACSSSLVALNRAILAMENDECDVSLVGGCNLLLSPKLFIAFSQAGMLSADGQCKTFDNSANGYVRGEGIGCILIKKTKQAKENRDNIYCKILSVNVNHSGATNSLTAPSTTAQAKLIQKTLQKSQLSINDIGYIECHGTGTKIGDPIEINALLSVAKEEGADTSNNTCGLSSVKTNVGHLEGAAGVAGLIRAALAIKHKTIPSLCNFTTINEYIDIESSPFYLVTEKTQWQKHPIRQDKRRAGISSFGFGGVNAHAILEEYPDDHDQDNHDQNNNASHDSPELLVMSAKSSASLFSSLRVIKDFLCTSNSHVTLSQIAYTLQVGRLPMPYRVAFVCSSIENIIAQIDNLLDDTDYIPQKCQQLHRVEKTVIDYTTVGTEKLKSIWMDGIDIDWVAYNNNRAVRRISLPSYVFEKNQHWFEAKKEQRVEVKGDQNRENLSSRIQWPGNTLVHHVWNASDQLVMDHVINSDALLPGVSCFKLVQDALVQDRKIALVLSNVVWVQPIMLNRKSTVKTSLSIDYGNDVNHFEIFTENAGSKTIHCSGKFDTDRRAQGPWPEFPKNRALAQDDIYGLIEDYGYKYGPSLKNVTNIAINRNEVCTKLTLDNCVNVTNRTTCLLDSALHGVLYYLLSHETSRNVILYPYMIKNYIDLRGQDTHCSDYYVLALENNKSNYSGDVYLMDVYIFDENFTICFILDQLLVKRKMLDNVEHVLQPFLKKIQRREITVDELISDINIIGM